MTIDPTKFEPQGMPTKEQVRTVWDAHPKPSARKIAEKLVGMGYQIGYRTVARWHESGWKDEPPKLRAHAEKGQPTGVKKEVRAAIAKESPAAVAEAGTIAEVGGLEAAVAGGKLTDPDYARIETLIKELATKEIADLRAQQEKDRIIMNIVLMREATRRAHVMTLIPKDTSSLVSAFTDDAKAVAAPAPIEPGGEGPKLNGSNGHAPMIEGDFKVVNPTAAAIGRFLAKENA